MLSLAKSFTHGSLMKIEARFCGPSSALYFMDRETILGHASKLLSCLPETMVQALCQVSVCPRFLLLPRKRLGAIGYSTIQSLPKEKIGDVGPSFAEQNLRMILDWCLRPKILSKMLENEDSLGTVNRVYSIFS